MVVVSVSITFFFVSLPVLLLRHCGITLRLGKQKNEQETQKSQVLGIHSNVSVAPACLHPSVDFPIISLFP